MMIIEEDDQGNMIEELQELVENLEDVIHKVIQDQSAAQTEVSQMKT